MNNSKVNKRDYTLDELEMALSDDELWDNGELGSSEEYAQLYKENGNNTWHKTQFIL